MNENSQSRPPMMRNNKNILGTNQIRKVYGNQNEIQGLDIRKDGRRTDLSPSNNLRARPESSKNRVYSGDPRLRGLESIYLNKFNKNIGSQKSLGLKRPFMSN